MSARLIALMVIGLCGFASAAQNEVTSSGERKLNNLVSVLLEVSSVSKGAKAFTFARSSDGWVFISSISKGMGTANILLDKQLPAVIVHETGSTPRAEAI